MIYVMISLKYLAEKVKIWNTFLLFLFITSYINNCSELLGQEIFGVSITNELILDVSKEGCAFGRGSNEYGKICLGEETESISSFTEISSLFGYEIRAAYAVGVHSLFETREGKILSCGDNFYGELLLSNGLGENVYSLTETTITSILHFRRLQKRLFYRQQSTTTKQAKHENP